MAASQTTTSFLKLAAQGDVVTDKLIVAGVLIAKTSLTTQAFARLLNSSSTVEYVPLIALSSSAQPVYIPFPQLGGANQLWDGVKAANCTGCTIMIYKR